MNRLKLVIGFCMIGIGISSCIESETPPSQTEQVEWGYEEENGAHVWSQLNPEFALCAEGTLQSPIDLVNPTTAELPAIAFNYQPTVLDIRNNGHTIEVASTEDNRIEVDGTGYELLQFHFHGPSEHTIDGKLFDMEMHLVHRNDDGTLAVIGVLIEQGNDNAAFNTLWAHLPDTAGETIRTENTTIDVDDLLPSDRGSYRYDGSLTTPPCSEGVRWIVLTTPIELSDMQIAAFKAIVHDNNRPIQPLNERELLLDVTENGQDG